MNTTTSPQVGKGTLRDAGILEQDEDDNDNARGRQSMTDFMMTAGTGNCIAQQCVAELVLARVAIKSLRGRPGSTRDMYSVPCSSSLCCRPSHMISALMFPGRTSMQNFER